MYHKRITDQRPAMQASPHPTPMEIEGAILRALSDDYDKHPRGGDVPFIPVRVSKLVHDAIAQACGGAA